MKSSYLNKIDYSDLFKLLCFLNKPKNIIEIGILEGYSLEQFINNTDDCIIKAYDIFEEFNGNSANKETLQNDFQKYDNITVDYGDFYKLCNTIQDTSIDILHIDIANNGDAYEYMFQNYASKIKNDGVILMEGGSVKRDNISWMIKYNKPKIKPVLEKWSKIYNILTIGDIPSITIIKNK